MSGAEVAEKVIQKLVFLHPEFVGGESPEIFMGHL